MCRNFCFDKVELCRTATSLKTSFWRSCFLVKFTKYVGTPFLQNTTRRLLLVIAVSIVVKGELANETINHRNHNLKHICPNLRRKCKLLKGQSW